MKKGIVKYTINVSDRMMRDMEQFSKASGLMTPEVARLAIEHYLGLPNKDFGFCIRKDTSQNTDTQGKGPSATVA
jgi:hypothetical protein